jgi:hypothetical protein
MKTNPNDLLKSDIEMGFTEFKDNVIMKCGLTKREYFAVRYADALIIELNKELK